MTTVPDVIVVTEEGADPVSVDVTEQVAVVDVVMDPPVSVVDVFTNAPGLQVVEITQAGYDALPVKDPNTLYIITG